jgi:hypothetical protein
MDFTSFIKRSKGQKLHLPQSLSLFHKKYGATKWQILKNYNDININFEFNGVNTSYNIDQYLTMNLAPKEQIIKLHLALVEYLNNNSFKDGLPLYLIRRHGSRSGIEGSKMRRRGWLVRFDNAYIVYADNFFPRHFFESTYYVSAIENNEISYLIRSLEMPFSSGGGKYEKINRIFPALNHLTASSNLYLSHIYDVNKGNFMINGTELPASHFLGSGIDSDFGCGLIEDWEKSDEVINEKKVRVIKKMLHDDTIAFLKASNLRALSPLNYFPFPKNKLINAVDYNGESYELREEVIKYYKDNFTDIFKDYQRAAAVV